MRGERELASEKGRVMGERVGGGKRLGGRERVGEGEREGR